MVLKWSKGTRFLTASLLLNLLSWRTCWIWHWWSLFCPLACMTPFLLCLPLVFWPFLLSLSHYFCNCILLLLKLFKFSTFPSLGFFFSKLAYSSKGTLVCCHCFNYQGREGKWATVSHTAERVTKDGKSP